MKNFLSKIILFNLEKLRKISKSLGKYQDYFRKKIIIEHSDYFDVNQIEAPDAALLTGNVRVNHDGIIMTCNKAYYFQNEK